MANTEYLSDSTYQTIRKSLVDYYNFPGVKPVSETEFERLLWSKWLKVLGDRAYTANKLAQKSAAVAKTVAPEKREEAAYYVAKHEEIAHQATVALDMAKIDIGPLPKQPEWNEPVIINPPTKPQLYIEPIGYIDPVGIGLAGPTEPIQPLYIVVAAIVLFMMLK